MKKLLTIMLAVLLAVPAVAASAEDNVKNADIIIVGAGGGGLSAAIEPVLLAAIAVLVLLLALGVFLPLWNMGAAAMGKGGG